jgi:hypothetical protein
MAFGTTLTLTLGGSGGTAKVLNRVETAEAFSSMFFLREATQEFTVRIRHSSRNVRGVPSEYHNVEAEQVVFETDTTPQRRRKAYTTMVYQVGDDNSALGDLGNALAYFYTPTVVTDLLGKLS